jgi:MerR family regulatory protein
VPEDGLVPIGELARRPGVATSSLSYTSHGLVPIGEPARHSGVATSSLRYCERIGLLSPAERAGQRRPLPGVDEEVFHAGTLSKQVSAPSRARQAASSGQIRVSCRAL